MTPKEFTYWLQGFTELTGSRPTEAQWLAIKDHLKLVFNKVTPDRASPNSPPFPIEDKPWWERYPYTPNPYRTVPLSPWGRPPDIIC